MTSEKACTLQVQMQREKKVLLDQQPSEQNNTAQQSDKLQQLYMHENHSYNANLLICDTHIVK